MIMSAEQPPQQQQQQQRQTQQTDQNQKPKKILIERLDRDEGDETRKIPVAYYPTEYQVNKAVTYAQQSPPGTDAPIVQFVSGQAETLSMELLFDTYEEGTDVREAYLNRLDDLVRVEGDLHAPPKCRVIWGTFAFTAVLESLNKTFVLFLDDGTPVRARVSLTFKQVYPPAQQVKEESRNSADRTKLRVVTESDTLPLVAAREYGDPTAWRPIAAANGITNPRRLEPGRELIVPVLEVERR